MTHEIKGSHLPPFHYYSRPKLSTKINLLKMFFLVIFASLFLFQAAVCEEDETEFALVSMHLLVSKCFLIW